jgi:hypothetical protein
MHRSSGHVWQGRFYSCPLDSYHLWVALRYAELNPVRAGLVAKAESWRWSSAAAHCGSLEPDTGLAMEMWNKRWSMETWREYLAAGETECEISRRFVSARTQAARWARRNSCTRWSKRRSAAWWRKRVGVQGMPSTIGHKLCWHSRNSLDSHGPGNFPRKRKRPVCPRFVGIRVGHQ